MADVIDLAQLAADAGLAAELLAAQGVHGQQLAAGDTGCLICDMIWRIRETCEQMKVTIEIPPPFKHP
jgi:hypothetical protein